MLYFDELESFRPSDTGGEQMSEKAFEQFREQMRSAAQQLKALQKGEQKKKKKEDKLAKILAQFLQKQTKTNLVLLAAEVLAEDIPPSFVLSVMLLTDTSYLDDARKTVEQEHFRMRQIELDEKEIALVPQANGEIVDWMNIMAEYAARDPIKFLKTVKNEGKKLKYILIEFVREVLKDYFSERKIEIIEADLEKFSIQILRKMIDQIENNAEHLEQLHEQDMTGQA